VVRREENGVLGVELHERLGVAAVGRRDVPVNGVFNALSGGRVGD
jgi:hypothetical protein